MGFIEDRLDQSDSSLLFAETGNCIIVLIKDRHDDYFINDVPHINDAFKTADLTVNSLELFFHDGFVIVLHEPVGTYSVPAKGVTLDFDVFTLKIFCGIHKHLCARLSFFRLKTAPVERKRTIVEDLQPAVCDLLSLFGR